MAKKPTVDEIQRYLDIYNPLDLAGSSITRVNEHNHLIYRLSRHDKKDFCLRMINPESYRRREWISMADEYALLKLLEPSGLGPKAYFVDERRFPIPLLIQEFVTGAHPFNALQPLQEEHIVAAAKAIALLNSQNITPRNFNFRRGKAGRHDSYGRSVWVWRWRLCRALVKSRFREDILIWFWVLREVVNRAAKILKQFEPMLKDIQPSFHFDGAHCGNTYWKEDQKRVIFLDWESVSYRRDPAFTAARFLTSVDATSGEISLSHKDTFLRAYLAKPHVPRFAEFVDIRLFERQVADLVWVLWDYVRRGDLRPLAHASSIEARYQGVLRLLAQYEY